MENVRKLFIQTTNDKIVNLFLLNAFVFVFFNTIE